MEEIQYANIEHVVKIHDFFIFTYLFHKTYFN